MPNEKASIVGRPWEEPAHPMIFKYRDDLLAIYKLIREKYQTRIDKAFDSVSRQIGFVVVTSVACSINVDDKGAATLSMGAENLQGTLYERELLAATEGLKKEKLNVSAGKFNIYLLWFNALKFKFRTEWIEPAHFRRIIVDKQILVATERKLIPDPQEPAHWFDPGFTISSEEAVLIAVIDEVYPELHLADKITSIRAKLVKLTPGIPPEPVHKPLSSEETLRQIRKILEG